MNKIITRILLLALMLLTVFSLASCDILSQYIDIPGFGDDSTDGDGDGSTDGGNDTPVEEAGKLLLIHNGKAMFNVVYTYASGAKAKKAAETFVKDLRNLGVEINDAVSDRDASAVTERELIIGANALNRGDDCCVTTTYLGRNGQIIKIVGDKIVIAGGTSDLTVKTFDIYVANEMKITSKVTSITSLSVRDDYNYKKLTKYSITSIKIDGVSLADFTLVLDVGELSLQNYPVSKIEKFADDLYDESGIFLNSGKIANVDSYDHAFIIRYVDTYEGNSRNKDHELERSGGFRAYVDGKDYIVECCYMSTFERSYIKFLEDVFLSKRGDVVVENNYTDEANTVYYEEFGAKGNGVTDDYQALYDTHIFANKCGQRVRGKEGAHYFVAAASRVATIPVTTDIDFNGATITVDDYGSAGFANRGVRLFTLDRQPGGVVTLTGEEVYALYEEYRKNVNPEAPEKLVIDPSTESFPWLAPKLEVSSMVRIISSTHKDFVRHGANENAGTDRIDVFMVEANGNFVREGQNEDLDGNGIKGNVTTPVAYSFGSTDPNDPSVTIAGLNAKDAYGNPTFNNDITQLIIYRNDDAPINIKNGKFYNICCQCVSDTNYEVKYEAYAQGFQINRSNVTIENITHRMKNEPDFHTINKPGTHTCDKYCKQYGSRQESYPYYGFFNITYTSNILVKNCSLTAHTAYYEDKPATGSTGGQKPEPVPAGSYDFLVDYSCNVVFDTVVQGFTENPDRPGEELDTGLGDQRYWGIMNSNGSKNMTFKNCKINRFDAHRGFWNATLIDTVIGHTINVVGGGTFNLIRVEKITNNCGFIFLRSDYGGSFRGDMNIVDCEFKNYPAYQTTSGTYLTEKTASTCTMIMSGFATTNQNFRTTAELTKSYNDEYNKVYNQKMLDFADEIANGSMTQDEAEKKADADAKKSAANMSKQGGYWLWDFGYDCYLPIKVNIRNFQCKADNIYIFNAFPDAVFKYNYDPNNVTSQSVTNVLNKTQAVNIADSTMPANMRICSNMTNYREMSKIPVNTNFDWRAAGYDWGEPSN